MKLTRWYSERSWCQVLPPHKPSQESHWTPSPPNHLEKLASSVKANDSARYLIYLRAEPLCQLIMMDSTSGKSKVVFRIIENILPPVQVVLVHKHLGNNVEHLRCYLVDVVKHEVVKIGFDNYGNNEVEEYRRKRGKIFPNQCISVRIIPLHPIAVLQSVHLRKSRCQRNSEVWFEYKLHFLHNDI